MARTSHANIMALPDVAQSWNFDLFLPTIPGGGSATNLTYRCKSTTLPSSTIEPVKIELHGVAKQEAGRAQYSHTFQATFIETVDYTTYLAFRKWRDYMRSWKNNTGSNSQAYAVQAELDVYDNAGNVINTMILAGVWPTEVGDVAFDGAASNAIEMTITFSFNYIDDGSSY